MIALSKTSPPTFIDSLSTTPPRDITAISHIILCWNKLLTHIFSNTVIYFNNYNFFGGIMIVDSSVKYNSKLLKDNINSLIIRYPFIKVITIGYSVLGVPIYCIKIRYWF